MKRDILAELGVRANSPAPSTPEATQRVLMAVPELASAADFEGCLFDKAEIASTAAQRPREQLTLLSTAAHRERVRAVLNELSARAQRESNGGLLFLTKTLEHFLETLPAHEHPLLVALYVRSVLRYQGAPETGAAIALQLDGPEWA